MQRITITVEPDGTDSIDLEGFHGKGCMKLLEQLADGDTPIQMNHKREYNETAVQTERAKS